MKLSEHMEAKGLKLREVQDLTGFSLGYLSELSRGIKRPTLEAVDIIAEATGGAVMGNDWMEWRPTPKRRKALATLRRTQ